jgi:MYXO-CTERM domain-containing protein
MPMWLSKPIYEFLPYFYAGGGGLLLAASVYLDYGYWPATCLTLGLSLLVAGALLWWRRRTYRNAR